MYGYQDDFNFNSNDKNRFYLFLDNFEYIF